MTTRERAIEIIKEKDLVRPKELNEGIETHRLEGVTIRVCSAAKTVADCFKYRNKVGLDVAVEALRDFNRHYRGGATELARFVRICRVRSPEPVLLRWKGLEKSEHGDFYVRSGPGTVRLDEHDVEAYIATRFGSKSK